MAKLTSYELSRDWFDWCFSNPELVTPNHTALYFFCIEHCNRLGWKEKFGLPMEMAKDAIGIKNYRTYSKTFTDLVEWGFLLLIQKSVNQYSANVIALVKNTKAKSKALDNAMIGHGQKQSQKQVHGIVGIDKPITINNKQLNNKQDLIEIFFNDLENSTHFEKLAIAPGNSKESLKAFIPVFRDKANLEYPSFIKFVEHFKNAFNIYKNQNNGKQKFTGNDRRERVSSVNNLENLAFEVLRGDQPDNG